MKSKLTQADRAGLVDELNQFCSNIKLIQLITNSNHVSIRFSLCLCLIFLIPPASAQLPFKYDSLYKTIYAKDLCKLAKSNKNLLLIDVRSRSEFGDSSKVKELNLGHLKNAINIDIAAIRKDISVLNPYKDKTIILYCSHSNRSRIVAKLMSENEFTDFYNLNGGMSEFHKLTEKDFPCKKEWIETNLPYKHVSGKDAISLIKKMSPLIIDLRSSTQYNSNDTIPYKNLGRIRRAINIPYKEWNQRLSELTKYKKTPILIYSSSGHSNAAKAALDLCNSGFSSVYYLTSGYDLFLAGLENTDIIEQTPYFTLVDPERALALMKSKKNLIFFDTREDKIFNNQMTGGMSSMYNLGYIKGSKHIIEANFDFNPLPENKETPILLHGNEESYRYAEMIRNKGYKQIYMLNDIYEFVWATFNIESCKEGKKLLLNHQGFY